MYPKISIITPSYNQGRYLEENILSVINQQYPNVEHIIIDGGSTDNTKEVLEKYKDKLAYAVSEPDKGQSDAVNKGFAKATGEIIGWLNSDDYYAPGALHAVSQAFSGSNIQAVTGAIIINYENGKQRRKGPPAGLKGMGETYYTMTIPNQPATFFSREAFVTLMPVNTTLHYVMDYELWLRYLLKYSNNNIVVTDDVLAHFRIHGMSKSGSQGLSFEKEWVTVLNYLAKHNKMDEVSALLESNFSMLNDYAPSFREYPGKEMTRNLLRLFLLRKGGEVHYKKQFDYSRKAFEILDMKQYSPLPEEKKEMEQLQRITSSINWNHFRVKRKIRNIFPVLF